MKHILLILLVFTSINLNAQNGGQAPENEMIKLENVASGVKVTNKQFCKVEFKTNQTDNFHLASYSDTIIQGLKGKFKVKPLDKCQSGDMGWVEIDVNSSLPVKIESVNIKDAILTLKVADEKNVEKYILQGSNESNVWKSLYEVKAKGSNTYEFPLHSYIIYSFFPFLLIGLIRNKKILGIALLGIVLYSCTKTVETNNSEHIRYFRVVAVDYDGNQTFSNIVK